jgi:hypothetical protein
MTDSTDANGLEPSDAPTKRELIAENARLRDVIARGRREARSWPARRVDLFAEGVDRILAESGVEAAPR